MKHFRLLLSTLFILGLAWQGYAQNASERAAIRSQSNVATLEKLAQGHAANYAKKKAEAQAFAQQRGLQVLQVLPGGRLAELQYIDDSGTPIYYVTTSNLNAAITTRANKLWTGGGLNLNLNGQGMVVGEWDGGPIRAAHQEFGGRVVQKDGVAFTSSNGNTNHATHVGGTLIASGVQANAKGMAHQGILWANEWNNDLAEMTAQAAEGLIISNHSYGYNSSFLSQWQFGFYDNTAANWDEIAFNAPFYTIVKAAGNDRGAGYNTGGVFGTSGYNLVTGSATSKNVLVVAAVSAVTNYTGPGSVTMSSFSSWGPTDDGRIKPDISGCGVSVYSASSTGNTAYSTLSGTSMASPNVAGTLTLIQQHYKNLNSGAFMRSATLRGLAIHTADEAGAAPGPDYRFGWGLLNAEKAVNAISGRGISAIIDERSLSNGTSYTTTVVASGTAPLEVTIAWTDPKGVPLANGTLNSTSTRLVNDLDIRVSYNGTTSFPWRLDPAAPANAATQGDNFRDNVEKIFIENPVAGATYTITVNHKNTLQNGVQAFSLIVTGISNSVAPTCTVPQNLSTSAITATSATLNWGTVTGAVSYDVRIRVNGTTTWSDFNGRTTTSISFTGLAAATTYEWQVRSNCSGGSSAYSASSTFTSAAAAVVYCASRGNSTADEWIQRVQIGSINNNSGSNNGYADFTSLSTSMGRGSSQSITIIPGWRSTRYQEAYAVWIDWNQDGDFLDAGELVFSRARTNVTSISGTFTVPTGALLGNTRMRVSMKYNVNPTSCETFAYGEVEDYTINVTATGSALEVQSSILEEGLAVELYPNPAHESLRLRFGQATEGTVQLLNLSGQVLMQSPIRGSTQDFDVRGLAEGMYLIQIESKGVKDVKKFIIRH